MNGAPLLSALIAPRYSFTTWCSIVRLRAPSAFFTLMPVNAFERLRTRLDLVLLVAKVPIVSSTRRTFLRHDRSAVMTTKIVSATSRTAG